MTDVLKGPDERADSSVPEAGAESKAGAHPDEAPTQATASTGTDAEPTAGAAVGQASPTQVGEPDAVAAAAGARTTEPAVATGSAAAETAAATEPPGRVELTEPLRYLLAALSGAAGVIHLAMVPSHVDEWAAEGAAFAVVGWAQLVMALLALTRPSRLLLRAIVGANLVFLGAWAVTRTAGAPFGPHSGHAESVSSVDLATVGFEVALIGLAGALLMRPAVGRWAGRGTHPLGASLVTVAPAVVLALTTVVLASPAARNHAHDSHDGHGEGAGAGAGAGHEETGAGGHHGGGAGAGHGERALAPILEEDDRGLSQLRNGHHHEIVEHELDAATQAELDEQLALTREVAAQYPTLADARAAGFTRIGPYFPGIGAHYRNPNPAAMNQTGIMDRESILNPFVIVYDGSEPTSRIAGFMYLSMADHEPEGFAGPNDVWHNHQDLCLKDVPNGEIDVPFGLDHQSNAEQCASVGGEILPISPWMVHVWSAPGYDDDPDVGVFHEVHTDLTCEDGTYHTLAPEEWATHQLNICRAGAA